MRPLGSVGPLRDIQGSAQPASSATASTPLEPVSERSGQPGSRLPDGYYMAPGEDGKPALFRADTAEHVAWGEAQTVPKGFYVRFLATGYNPHGQSNGQVGPQLVEGEPPAPFDRAGTASRDAAGGARKLSDLSITEALGGVNDLAGQLPAPPAVPAPPASSTFDKRGRKVYDPRAKRLDRSSETEWNKSASRKISGSDFRAIEIKLLEGKKLSEKQLEKLTSAELNPSQKAVFDLFRAGKFPNQVKSPEDLAKAFGKLHKAGASIEHLKALGKDLGIDPKKLDALGKNDSPDWGNWIRTGALAHPLGRPIVLGGKLVNMLGGADDIAKGVGSVVEGIGGALDF